MPTFPKSLFWRRTDTAGADHALIDDRSGLRATGVALAAAPLPYTCRYELATDPQWGTGRLEVTAEGAGWQRRVRLERKPGEWRVTTSEQGDLGRALTAAGRPRPELPGAEDPDRLAEAADVDLGGAPLFNTLPVRRLGLLSAPAGTEHRLTVAWVVVPSLAVVAAEQTYTALGGGRVRYSSASFTAELELDEEGYVRHYPGLANRD
ncbi:putative glycolipid-binding domain-containing protein [Natronosporangium hydrolyticum]|uniref:Putative glycolipid-binding domain-containing protein n=1 Tax=Natronosporangium hydrolyticum TaxID=2811111 RepID=A0A895YHF0_9ACTN|nr:putative glycolipid-binding domain-containing protein [Natronosporangium hydrolyticum]QSB14939.1 putative glycolipid-binding domain-containing protein [Natronosporangium hydrolyticum]